MYFDQINSTKERNTNARELAMHAREHEKEMALLAGLYRSAKPGRKGNGVNLKVLLTGLFTGI